MNRGVEIEFTDGEKRTVPNATAAFVENDCLHLECKQESFGFAATYHDLGSFPLVNIKSYHWME
jgi:hypothetical protein